MSRLFGRRDPFRTMSSRNFLVLSLFLLAVVSGRAALEDEIKAFEAADSVNPPPHGAILFVGSSTIKMWSNLPMVFTNHTVFNRGFGGSQMSDVLFYFDRVVLPYRPALVAVYEGDNDLAAGKTVDQVYRDYTNFLSLMQIHLPGTDIALIAVKPSPSRVSIMPQMQALNSKLQALADGQHIRFIDVFTPMLNSSNQPRPELFLSDMLHMNATGYALWQSIVGPVLDDWALDQGQVFLFDFGAAETPTLLGPAPNDTNFWNNVTSIGIYNGGLLTNLLSSSKLPSYAPRTMSLGIISRFNGMNQNGTLLSPHFPANATRDSLYGNTELFSGESNIYPAFKLAGLDREMTYNLTFFASRDNVNDNREAGYTVTGANTGYALLNAANNVSGIATVPQIRPDGAGEIRIDIAPTTNNNNANHFTYLGVLKVESFPQQTPIVFTLHPSDVTVQAGQPAVFTAHVAGSRPHSIQWRTNGVPVPGASLFNFTIPQTTTEMSGTSVSVTVSNLAFGAVSAPALLTVVADTNAPTLLFATASSGLRVELAFSEPLGASAGVAGNYSINGQPVVGAELLADRKTVQLTLGIRLSGNFVVVVSGVQDLSGNLIASGSSVAGRVSSVESEPILFDFGGSGITTTFGPAPDDPTNYWNNVTEALGGSATGRLSNAVTSQNSTSTVSLVMIRRFNGANLSGTRSSDLFPSDATSDSLFGNTELFSGLTNVFPSFKLIGLNPGMTYNLVFYASRTGVSDNRETEYSVSGENTNFVALNAANNVSATATAGGIVPAPGGEITVGMMPTANNNNANHFTYLGVLKVIPMVPPEFVAPVISGNQIQLNWIGTGQLEWAPNAEGPWSAISPTPEPPYSETLHAEGSRFFRIKR